MCLDEDLDGECYYPTPFRNPSNNGERISSTTDWIVWAQSMRCSVNGDLTTDEPVVRKYSYYVENMFVSYPGAGSIGQNHAAEVIQHYEDARR